MLSAIAEMGATVSPKRPVVRVRTRVHIPIQRDRRALFVTFDGLPRQAEHFAVCFQAPDVSETPLLVRIHSECVTGDVFGSLRCDCGAQLEQATELLAAHGGVLLYLRQEGRGIGLRAKLDAYKLQDQGLDTFDANRALSHPADARDYGCAADMLRALGVQQIRLITNNPDKLEQLLGAGIEVTECLATGTFLSEFNRAYLAAKVLKAGHKLDL